jgi:hydroxyethylthiazole kinase
LKKQKFDAYALLEKLRIQKPVVHHLTNWVTIYDCAAIVKAIGGSPIMAYAQEELEQMTAIASSLVLNIGTITAETFLQMRSACAFANKRGIPVILDCCGAGASFFRDECCNILINKFRVDIIKGNSSEIARIAGENVRTKGVDAVAVNKDLKVIAKNLARRFNCAVVITGKEDIIANSKEAVVVKNGHAMMANIVGTGCMAASLIGAFAAVEKDLVCAASCALACFGIAAECAAKKTKLPGSFKEKLYDCIYALDKKTVKRLQKISLHG